MKKTLFVTSIFLFGTQINVGMEKKAELKSIEAMIYTDSRPVAIESAARVLQTSVAHIKSLQTIHESEIQSVSYRESSDYKSYSAPLSNGDIVSADFFMAGLAKGTYECSREVGDAIRTFIPLSDDVYAQLQKIYEAQK